MSSVNPDHDYVPSDPDSYTVTFVRGRLPGVHPTPTRSDDLYRLDIGRVVERDIMTFNRALEVANEMDAEMGRYGRRAIIHAIKGSRSYMVPRHK